MILTFLNFIFFMILALWFCAKVLTYDHFQGSFLRCVITFFGGVIIYLVLIAAAILPIGLQLGLNPV